MRNVALRTATRMRSTFTGYYIAYWGLQLLCSHDPVSAELVGFEASSFIWRHLLVVSFFFFFCAFHILMQNQYRIAIRIQFRTSARLQNILTLLYSAYRSSTRPRLVSVVSWYNNRSYLLVRIFLTLLSWFNIFTVTSLHETWLVNCLTCFITEGGK